MDLLGLVHVAAVIVHSSFRSFRAWYIRNIKSRPEEEGWTSLPRELKIKALSTLPLGDLNRVSQCPELRSLARDGLKARVYRILRKFFLNPSSILKMMRRTRTVLSGSAALKIVDAGEWEENDLDFYCPKDQVGDVIDWFTKHGYAITETTRSYPPRTAEGISQALESVAGMMGRSYTCSEEVLVQLGANNCIEAVFTLRHEAGGTKINIIQSRSSSALAPIAFFHSTIVMNVVTADTVICGYPSLTLQGKGLMNIQTMPPLRAVKREVAGVVKYQGRGYTFVQGIDEDPTFDPARPIQSRTWGDRHTLRMRFRGKERVDNAGEIAEEVRWAVSYRDYIPRFGFVEYPASCIVGELGGGRVEYANFTPEVYLRCW